MIAAAPLLFCAVEVVFDAVAVSGDFLLAAFQRFDFTDFKRVFLVLNLNTATVDGNFDLVSRVQNYTENKLTSCANVCQCLRYHSDCGTTPTA